MGRKYVLVDDLDGSELPDDIKPVNFSVGSKRYRLYLSDDNHGKFLEAVRPFIENAELVYDNVEVTKAASKADKEKMKQVRKWAQDSGYEFKGADGEMRTLGDRGRIPQEVIDAYDAQV